MVDTSPPRSLCLPALECHGGDFVPQFVDRLFYRFREGGTVPAFELMEALPGVPEFLCGLRDGLSFFGEQVGEGLCEFLPDGGHVQSLA